MATDIAHRFIDALHTLESDGTADALATLYADDAVSGNTATTRTYDGPEGAREFWSGYRKAFGEIRSEFRTVVSGDDAAALEWVSTGTLSEGDSITYEGVTLLHFEGDRITRSTAYFDPRAILGDTGAV
jgi:ketosteroid isomerase-like protein